MASSSAVNRPVDVKLKERDVNNKLQLYGIYSAFANGKLPSNKQIDVALNSLLASKALSSPSQKLSPEGQKLVTDFKDVIEQAKLLVLTKNEGNVFQDFVWQTQQVSAGDAKTPNAPVDKDTAKQHGNEALDGLRTLGKLIISNGQFRKLLKDAQILARDVIGDAATNAAGKINPSDEQLRQIDAPAEDNTWHEVPEFSKDKLTGQVKSQWSKARPQAQNTAEQAAQDAQYHGQQDPQQGAQAGAQTLLNAAQEQIPDDVQQQAKETKNKYVQQSKEYWSKKVPKDRREQTTFRLKKMIVEIQGQQDYMQAVQTIIRLAEEYAGHSKHVALQGTDTVKDVRSDSSLKRAEADLRTIIERSANYTSLDDLFDSLNQIYKDSEQDPELRQWFRDLNTYIRKLLLEQGYVLQDESTERWNELYDRGRYLLREKYRSHTNRILDELKFLGNQFDADAQNKQFAQSITKLFTELGNDDEGKPTFKPHLVKDLTEVILPSLFENVRYVPIPRIEYSDPQIDAIIENLVIESDNLAPNVLEIGSDNFWRWGRKKITSKHKNKIMISVSGIQMDLRDVSYYIKRKQGSPKLTDKGVADIFLGGNGLTFKIELETVDKDSSKAHLFQVNKVSVDIKKPVIKLKTSSHKLLFAIFKPLALKLIRPALEKVVEQQIRENISKLDALAFEVQREANKIKADLKNDPTPENAQNMYQRYATAFNTQVSKTKKKATEAVADKKVNVAVTKHDSMFKDISLPGGISSKATEYKELAAKGDKWESPIFSIGSSAESTGLPVAQKVSRKPHSASQTGGGLSQGLGQQQGGFQNGGALSDSGYQTQDGGLHQHGAGLENKGLLPDTTNQQGLQGGYGDNANALGQQMDKSFVGINGNHNGGVAQNGGQQHGY